jgi:mRNA interferase MazF
MYKNKLNKLSDLIEWLKSDINLPIISDFLEWFYEKLNLHFIKKMPNFIFNKWDIYFVNLWKNIGSELNKNRPCIVISEKKFNAWNSIVIIPLKSYKWKIKKKYQIMINLESLKKKSVVDVLSLRQIDKKRINSFIWKVNKTDLDYIEHMITKVFWLKNKE